MNEHPTGIPSTIGRCGLLAGATAGLWALLAAPAWSLAGAAGLEGLTYAALLCLVPGLIVFLAASFYGDVPTKVPFVILGGTALRLLFVLVGAVVVRDLRPHLGFREFMIWLLVLYLATLLVETLLAVRMSASGTSRSRTSGV